MLRSVCFVSMTVGWLRCLMRETFLKCLPNRLYGRMMMAVAIVVGGVVRKETILHIE
ncbi:hypothetical protein D3C80_1901370 [compost metagenome]